MTLKQRLITLQMFHFSHCQFVNKMASWCVCVCVCACVCVCVCVFSADAAASSGGHQAAVSVSAAARRRHGQHPLAGLQPLSVQNIRPRYDRHPRTPHHVRPHLKVPFTQITLDLHRFTRRQNLEVTEHEGMKVFT